MMYRQRIARPVQNNKTSSNTVSYSLILTCIASFFTFYASYRLLGDSFCKESPRFLYALGGLPFLLPAVVFQVVPVVRPVIKKLYYGLLTGLLLLFGILAYKDESSLFLARTDIITCFQNRLNAYRSKSGALYTIEYSVGVYFIIAAIALLLTLGVLHLSRRLHMRLLMLAAPLLSLVPTALVGRVPSNASYDLIVLCALLLGMAQFSGGAFGKPMRLKGIAVSLIPPLLVFLSFVIVPSFSRVVFLSDAAEMLEYSADSQQFFNHVFQKVAGVFTAHSTDMSVGNDSPSFTDKDVLTVTLSEVPRNNLYLKRTIGTSFNGTRWYDTFSAEDATYGELSETEIFQKLYVRDPYDDSSNLVQVTVEYIDYTSTDEPIPYQLSAVASDARADSDGLLKKAKKKQASVYSIWSPVADTYSLPNLSQIIYLAESQFAGTIPAGYEAYSIRENTVNQTGYEVVSQLASRLLVEGGYSGSVSEDGIFDNPARYALATKVSNYLAANYYYSLTPGEVPEDTSTIEYFLSGNKYGFCVHFATSAALILREMGVPARYVTGYIVKPNEFSRDENGDFVATVKDSAGHAWVEIYLDGYGWYPVEMTKGYAASSGESIFTPYVPDSSADESDPVSAGGTEAPDSSESSAQASSSDASQSASSSEVKASSADNPLNPSQAGNTSSGEAGIPGHEHREESGNTSGTAVPVLKILKYLLLLIVLVISLSGLFYFLPRYIKDAKRRKRNRLHRQLQRGGSVSVRKLNRIVYKQLSVRVDSDSEYKETLRTKFPEVTEGEWNTYFKLVESSLFGNEILSREDGEFLWQIMLRLEAAKQTKKARSQ